MKITRGSTSPSALGDSFVMDTAPAWFRPSIGNLSTSCLRVALIMGFIGRYRSILRDRVNLYPWRSGTGWLLDPTDTTVRVFITRDHDQPAICQPWFGRPRNSDPWLSMRMIGCVAKPWSLLCLSADSDRHGSEFDGSRVTSLNICNCEKLGWHLLKEFRN